MTVDNFTIYIVYFIQLKIDLWGKKISEILHIIAQLQIDSVINEVQNFP